MTIHTLPLGAYQTNTYILENEGRCVIIDPGYAPDTILRFLAQRDLTANAIMLTHGHFDHVGAVEKILEATGCRLWLSEKDWQQGADPASLSFYPLANHNLPNMRFFAEGDEISAADMTFTVLETPGHTPGSVCLLIENALFTGDTLFAGSCGRTDLPGGSWTTIQDSLRRLSALSDALRVYPGHGDSTTLAAEKQYNPYMR